MAPTTRRGQNTPTDNTNPNNMTLESVQAMIDQALQRNSTNGDASHRTENGGRFKPCCFDLVEQSRTLGPEFNNALKLRRSTRTSSTFLQTLWEYESSKPKTLDETIELANDLMDQKLRTYAEKSDNKRKADDSSRNNHGHQQQTQQ
ncbi:hypothetical protein Tco_0791277 [Tanacetum coccineum]